MSEQIIEIKDLWFSFNGQAVLQGVNLTIHRGDYLVVFGPNGGGKTVLLKLMLGLLKPTRGMIRVFGEPPGKAAHRIGYVPQNVHINKDFPVSVLDVVLMGCLRHSRGWSRYSRDDRAAAREALDLMKVWDIREQRIGELSGGQLQRVFIARALVAEPECLFLDEPMASIDTYGRGEFYELLYKLNKRVTIVTVSHDLMVLSSHVKAVACVNRELHYHDSGEMTQEMLDQVYHCPVDLVAHGVPHRVLLRHRDE
ncbi:MAG: ABC transporter ATP-binding protein [Thermodesulfobacteriota bacterium]